MLNVLLRSVQPHSTVLLVNTTPSSWFWLLPSGNGFVSVVSWQGLQAHLAGCGLVCCGWGCRSPGLGWGMEYKGESRGHFPPTAWKCFVNVTVCCLCCLQAGWFSWWKSCQWSETSTTVTHVITHWEKPEEMKHYRTVRSYVTRCQTQLLYL